MQSDPVKNVSLTAGLLGMGGQIEGAKANKGAADNGAFTAEIKKLLAIAEAAESGSTVKTATAGWNAGMEKTAAAVGGSKAAEEGAGSDSVDVEKMLWFAKLRAPVEEDGGTTDFDDEYAELSQEDKRRIGNELISHALKQIAAILGLPEDSDAPAAFEFDPSNIEQLAAIMAYLDLTIKMANDRIDVSANAEVANMAMAVCGIDSPIAHIEPEENAAELSEFAAALRTEKFRLDMAFRLIGVSDMIADKIAETSETGTTVGIPQAVNPANLSMSVADTVSAFSNLIREELSASTDRVRQIVRGQAEMTDLERAAVELGTVKSEILKAALSKADSVGNTYVIKGDTDVKLVVNTANVNTGVDKTGVKTDVNTGINTAKIIANAANSEIKADNNISVNNGVNNAVKVNINTADVKPSVNGAVNTNVNTEAKADADTVNVKADVNTDVNTNTAANKTVNTIVYDNINTNTKVNSNAANAKADVKADVDTNVKVDAKADTDTANVKADAKADVNTNVKVDAKVDANTANVKADVNTDVKVDAKVDINVNTDTANVKTDVQADVYTNVKVDAKADNNTANVKADANVDTNAKADTTVKADVNDNAKAEVDTAKVKSDVDSGVHTAVNTDVNKNVNTTANTANRTNRHEQKDTNVNINKSVNANVKPEAKAHAGTVNAKVDVNSANVNKANVNADVNKGINTAADTEVKADTKADVNTANVKTDVKTEAKADVKTAVNTNADTDADTEVKANDRVQKRAVDANLPISAHDSASRRVRSSVESANRLASMSAERVTGANTSSSGDSAELPTSVMALAQGRKAAKSADGETKSAATEPKTQAQAKGTLADGETAALPVSVMESSEKKHTPKNNGGVHAERVKAAAKAASGAIGAAMEADAAKTETAAANKAADEAFVAKLKQTIEAGALMKGASKASGSSSAKAAAQEKSAASANSASSSNSSLNSIESNADADLSVDNGDESEVSGVGSVDSASSRSAASAKHAEKTEAPAVSQDDRLEVIRQLSEKLNNAVRSGANEIRMVLRPEALGEVRMSLRVQGDVVFARMQVENKQVKAIVESSLQSLKDSLNRQNLEFGAIDVEVGAQSEGDKSPRELWQEMADRSESRGFRPSVGVAPDGTPIDGASDGFVSLGSDTGRRFGDNTFEYFA